MPIFVRESGGFVEMRNVYVRESDGFTQIQNVWVRESTGWTLVYRRAFVQEYNVNNNTNSSFVLNTRLTNDGWDGTTPVDIIVNINARQGSNNSLGAFVAAGPYPDGSTLRINIGSGDSIRGRGGRGGDGGSGSSGSNGDTGGTAVYLRDISTIIANSGTLTAGGTGGDGGDGATVPGPGPAPDPLVVGGGGGGGGAGSPAGSGGSGGIGDASGDPGSSGGLTSGGAGGDGAAGADAGADGFGPGLGPTTNRTGFAINGVSNVTSLTGNAPVGRQGN